MTAIDFRADPFSSAMSGLSISTVCSAGEPAMIAARWIATVSRVARFLSVFLAKLASTDSIEKSV